MPIVKLKYLVDMQGRIWDWDSFSASHPAAPPTLAFDAKHERAEFQLQAHLALTLHNKIPITPVLATHVWVAPATQRTGAQPSTHVSSNCNVPSCYAVNEYLNPDNYPKAAPTSFRCGQCRAHVGEG